jgi:hypothetical protein
MDFDLLEKSIDRTISPRDEMVAKDETHYFNVGRSALECVDLSLRAARMPVCEVRRILDLPCGHGRVLRWFRVAFPEAEITACDILRDGVDFCASTFGAVPIYSRDDPRAIPIERDAFDLVWVGSLLTHLNSDLWLDFLDVSRSSLRPGGLLIFTTHGLTTYRSTLQQFYENPKTWVTALYPYERTGFGYTKYADSDSYYGHSLSSPAWVLSQIAKVGRLRTVHVCERAWDNHHDCYTCVRDDSYQAGPSGITAYGHLRHRLAIRSRLRNLSRRLRPRLLQEQAR